MTVKTFTFTLISHKSKSASEQIKLIDLNPHCQELERLIQIGLDSIPSNPDYVKFLGRLGSKDYKLDMVYHVNNGKIKYDHGYLTNYHAALAPAIAFAFQALNQDGETVNIFWYSGN